MTKWLSPRVLASSAVEVAVSGAFGRYADKREIEGGLSDDWFDCRFGETGTYWLDFAADVGDGFDSTYTIAHFLAEDVELGKETLRRGRVLVLGGDEVYPSASLERYEEHFKTPYSDALPEDATEEGSRPRMFAIPGNHDWYDGLTSFMRTFCSGKTIGGWQTEQKRSYFALRLPHGWWLWATDIQFDTYIDAPQLDYFRRVAEDMVKAEESPKIILATAKPSWVAVTDPKDPPQSWQTLAFLEEKVMPVKPALTLTGDIHHYARYGETRPKLTAGGGGAYLSATHWLPPDLDLPSLDGTTTAYALKECWPKADASRKLLRGIWKHALPWVTPSLHLVTAAIYFVIAALIAAGIQDHDPNLQASLQAADGFALALDALSFWGVLVIGVVLLGLAAWAKRGKAPALAGAIHAVVQIAAATALTLLLLEWDPFDWTAEGSRLGYAVAVVVALASCLVARWILVIYLLLLPRLNARWHVEEAFAGQSIADYKNFLRLKLEPDALTVYAIGVRKVPTEWKGEGEKTEPADGKWPELELTDRWP
jgi:hypothetical protein